MWWVAVPAVWGGGDGPSSGASCGGGEGCRDGDALWKGCTRGGGLGDRGGGAAGGGRPACGRPCVRARAVFTARRWRVRSESVCAGAQQATKRPLGKATRDKHAPPAPTTKRQRGAAPAQEGMQGGGGKQIERGINAKVVRRPCLPPGGPHIDRTGAGAVIDKEGDMMGEHAHARRIGCRPRPRDHRYSMVGGRRGLGAATGARRGAPSPRVAALSLAPALRRPSHARATTCSCCWSCPRRPPWQRRRRR